MPRVTVITPAHDSAGTIAATVASVREQTFGDWEHVVADDASRDGTATILNGLAAEEPRLRVVAGETNRGPAAARNLAIEHATGELLAFLDADDKFLPAYLERLVGLYDAATGEGGRVGIVACNAYLEGPAGRLPGTYAERQGEADGATLTGLLRSNPIFVSALCPAALVRELGGFSTECWGSEDHDLWLRIVERGYQVVGAPEPLVVYRVAAGSVSSSRVGMARTTQATYRRSLERGRLDPAQRRIARGALRTARAAEAFERLAENRQAGWPARIGEALQALPAFASAALSQPGRWPHWTRMALARARRS
jgi:teichuronic acid biosynthesis glycosyltransferase TuaG